MNKIVDVKFLSNSHSSNTLICLVGCRVAGAAIGEEGNNRVEGNGTYKKQKVVTNYACFRLATMLTSNIITEIIENPSEFSRCANSFHIFVQFDIDKT